MDTLWMVKSSFVGMKNKSSFSINSLVNLTMVQCSFAVCSSVTQEVGVVCVSLLTGRRSAVHSCVFWNVTGGYWGGSLRIDSSNTYYGGIDITNCSWVWCSAVHAGGALALTLYHRSAVVACSFLHCGTNTAGDTGAAGGAMSFTEGSEVEVISCTFIECYSSNGGAIYMYGQCIVMVRKCVFLGNVATNGKGHLFFVHHQSKLLIIDSFTRVLSSGSIVDCFDASSCQTMQVTYDDTTCDTFSAVNVDGMCPTPCVASENACVKPHACPSNYVAVAGVCVPECIFWKPSNRVPECSPLCTPDATLGAYLCSDRCVRTPGHYTDTVVAGQPVCSLRPCAERTPLPSEKEPCGDNTACFHDTRVMGGGGMCVSACSGQQRPDEHGKCVTVTVCAPLEPDCPCIPKPCTPLSCPLNCTECTLTEFVLNERHVCAPKSCEDIAPNKCAEASWCVLTEDMPAVCAAHCTRADNYEAVEGRCVEKGKQKMAYYKLTTLCVSGLAGVLGLVVVFFIVKELFQCYIRHHVT